MRDLEKNKTRNGDSVLQKLLTSSLLPTAVSCDFSKLKIKVEMYAFLCYFSFCYFNFVDT